MPRPPKKSKKKSRADKTNERIYSYAKTGVKLGTLALQVAKLTSMLNVEKKYIDSSLSSQTVGQLTINATGAKSVDITPQAAEGATFNGRSGSSIKIVSAYMQFQFWHQANTTQPIKGKIYFVHKRGVPQSSSDALTDFFSVSAFSGIIDYNSQINPDNFGTYKIIKVIPFVVPSDQLSSQVQVKDVKVPLKLNHHVRYSLDTTTVTNGQMLMFIVFDSGNSSSTISTASNCPVLTAESGLIMNYTQRWYYVDN